jgi:hypothetical protein
MERRDNMSNKREKDYEIGYGKPPPHTQFKKGQSGNRRGRPKKNRDTFSAIDTVLARKVRMKENGKDVEIDYIEGLIQSLAQNALKAKPSEQIKVLRFIDEIAPGRLKQLPDWPTHITTEYVLPNGKTMGDYDYCTCSRKLDSFAKETPPEEEEDWLK